MSTMPSGPLRPGRALHHQLWQLTRRAAQWHVWSQEGSRRNAMVAGSVLTRRRLERDEVEAYLAALPRRGRFVATPVVPADVEARPVRSA